VKVPDAISLIYRIVQARALRAHFPLIVVADHDVMHRAMDVID
jgi:hypothetical protein